jgi:hypothetical protein
MMRPGPSLALPPERSRSKAALQGSRHHQHHLSVSLAPVQAVPWYALFLPLVVGLALRLSLVLLMPLPPSSDARWYFDRALELLETGRYAEQGVSTAYWPVGYPAFLALVSAPYGDEALAGQLANAVLALVLIALLFRWCMQLWGDWRVASTAAWLLALYPNHIGHTGALLTEPLYAVLVLAMVVVAQAQRLPARWPLAGLLAGLATLVKAQTLLFAPLLLALLAFAGRNGREHDAARAMHPWLVAMALMAATVLPWSARNMVVMGAPVLVSTNGGVTLLLGNNDDMYWGQVRSYVEESPLVQARRFTVADQVQADQRARALALNWIAQHPGQFIGLMPLKACRQWCIDGEAEWAFQSTYADYERYRHAFRTVRVLNQIFYVTLTALCSWALLAYWLRRRPPAHPEARQHLARQDSRARAPRRDLRHAVLPFMFLYVTALAMVFFGLPRYRMHLMPLVIGYAAALLVHWAQRRTRRRRLNQRLL